MKLYIKRDFLYDDISDTYLSFFRSLKYIYIFFKNIIDGDKIDISFNIKQSILFYHIIIIL